MKNLTKSFLCAGLAGGIAVSASGQIQTHMSEDFEGYSQTSDMTANWTWDDTGSNDGLVLETSGGNPGQHGFFDNDAATESAFQGYFNAFWTGSTINVTPTDENPLVLSGDIFYTGINNQRNTIGLRTGADPLFEMGFYNTGGNNGLGARILNFAGDDDWINVQSYPDLGTEEGDERWISITATFTSDSAEVVFVDTDPEGFGTLTHNSQGLEIGAFTDLRVGGPSDVGSATGGTSYDNITLETVPEPSTYAAIFGGLALIGAMVYRRRIGAKK